MKTLNMSGRPGANCEDIEVSKTRCEWYRKATGWGSRLRGLGVRDLGGDNRGAGAGSDVHTLMVVSESRSETPAAII